ncbi:hypothetical protein WH47_03326 [Habropoda laboriosa]|uniref:Uncharacterized protein n=1 Tax=Habropoda laboriosa TaxID=597456 RepID=A0A0L7RBF4_9HYME|nr:hypothetical protein WH47_03326 [Habropoda laboriosa]
MISSFPSYDEELLNSAYANISLIADKAWCFDKEDPFQKFNRSLWIQNCKLIAKYKENGTYRRKRVRDVIPRSHLATYGNYEYNEELEGMYNPDDNTGPRSLPNFCWTEVTEPWMLPEVEKHFAWLTSSGSRSSREFSATRIPQADDASKVGYGFKTHWEDHFQSQRVQRLSPTGKRIRMNYESNKEGNFVESDPAEKSANYYEHRRYTIENSMEMQLHIRVTSEAVRNLWKIGTNVQQQYAQQRMRLQCYQIQQPREQSCQSKERQQQFYYTFQYRPLILRTEYQTARTKTYATSKHLPPVLSPEVPEFFPKVPMTRFGTVKEQNTNRVQYFPSLNERSYQNELFPYNRAHDTAGTIYQVRGNVLFSSYLPSYLEVVKLLSIPLVPVTDTTFLRTPQQWYQRIPPPTQMHISSSSSTPMCTSVQPLRAATITHHPLQSHCYYTRKPRIIPLINLKFFKISKRQNERFRRQSTAAKGLKLSLTWLKTKKTLRGTKSESEVLQWLDSSCSSKTKEFAAANSLVSELRSFEGKNDRKASSSRRERNTSKKQEVQGSTSKTSNERDKNDSRNRRRLYRDVLTNASANQAAILENVFEKRYDELEQQAMEQYRTSEESLALKYQELERQAMEQYKCCGGNVQEDVTVARTSADDKQNSEDSGKLSKDTNCFDGQNCSGFGKCSPVTTEEEKEDKDCFTENRGNFVQESKNESSISGRCLTDKRSRSSVLSKSLTTLSRKISYGSKNTAKGASGDKMDKNVSVRASSKRRLILVSPFEKESEAKLTRSTDLEEFYCITQANKNIFGYYNNSKVGQIGGGDENITIIQSPRTEGTNNSNIFIEKYCSSELQIVLLSTSLAVRILDHLTVWTFRKINEEGMNLEKKRQQ